ncbi:MAG: response regulator [Deltaproteobacteria bacterium]|nr:response regulator [Deltaproteobacteria bacterium]
MDATILLIEDNEHNRYLTTFLLEAHGFKVVSAHDGRIGVDLARSLKPVLILLDIQLPTMDGYSVARALRSFDELKQTPIVAVTSYAMAGDREKALQAGCNGYIEKPINPESFATEVASFIAAQARTPQ